jgi:hypothetical protein
MKGHIAISSIDYQEAYLHYDPTKDLTKKQDSPGPNNYYDISGNISLTYGKYDVNSDMKQTRIGCQNSTRSKYKPVQSMLC